MTSISCTMLNLANNLFIFPNITINTVGMFILQIRVVSSDKQYTFTSTSNNIKVLSSNFTDNSLYYNNLELAFNGTFSQSQKYLYIATIYNYFLQKYNVELIGSIDSVDSSGILFGAGIDLSNSSLEELIINGTINDTDLILPGHSLIWLLLGNYELNITGKSLVIPIVDVRCVSILMS